MSDAEENAPNPMRQEYGDFAPALVGFTLDTLFGEVWPRPELSQRDRSLITVACLVSRGNMAQLPGHLTRATDNGLTEAELLEVITHLAFYAGWPQAMSALAVAKEFFRPGGQADGAHRG
jgi:4-carboxymuconolactone decarboxylase